MRREFVENFAHINIHLFQTFYKYFWEKKTTPQLIQVAYVTRGQLLHVHAFFYLKARLSDHPVKSLRFYCCEWASPSSG